MNGRKMWVLIAGPGLAVTGLLLLLLLLGRIAAGATISEGDSLPASSAACDTPTDPMERDLCRFVTGI